MDERDEPSSECSWQESLLMDIGTCLVETAKPSRATVMAVIQFTTEEGCYSSCEQVLKMLCAKSEKPGVKHPYFQPSKVQRRTGSGHEEEMTPLHQVVMRQQYNFVELFQRPQCQRLGLVGSFDSRVEGNITPLHCAVMLQDNGVMANLLTCTVEAVRAFFLLRSDDGCSASQLCNQLHAEERTDSAEIPDESQVGTVGLILA